MNENEVTFTKDEVLAIYLSRLTPMISHTLFMAHVSSEKKIKAVAEQVDKETLEAFKAGF